MAGYFKNIIDGTMSLITGMAITNKYCWQKDVTLQYPHESVKMFPRFRGHIELIKDPDTGTHTCISCGMCQKGCPSNCISLKGEKREGVKGKVLVEYKLDFTTCSLCGQCVENCKPGAIRFSNEYNLASPRKEDYHFDLLKRLEEQE